MFNQSLSQCVVQLQIRRLASPIIIGSCGQKATQLKLYAASTIVHRRLNVDLTEFI